MLSRLANVLQELSGEEGADGNQQNLLVPQLPAGDAQTLADAEVPEDAMERLAHLEQLVVQLKELIRDRDAQLLQKETELTGKDAQLKSEKEEAEARFTKLKLQAKAKMASLNKQISELKGQAGPASPDGSFAAVEEELQELKEQLSAAERLLQEKEAGHAEQLRLLQAVVAEKDVRFQEQIQRHEEELLKVSTPSQDGAELQQTLLAAQQRCAELEEALNSRSQELEMLQQEVSSADQQKQILTAQFRQMERELTEAVRLRQEEREEWAERARQADGELSALRASLQALEEERAAAALRWEGELAGLREAELCSRQDLEKERTEVSRLEAELAAASSHQEAWESDRGEIARLQSELAESAARLEALEEERSEVAELQRELTGLREEREDACRKSEVLAEAWTRLRSLAPETLAEDDPADPALLLDAVRSVETQLVRLKDECGERCGQLSRAVEALQEQLHVKTAEEELAAVRIRQLEQQIEMSNTNIPEALLHSSEADEAHISAVDQKLAAQHTVLVSLQESFGLATQQSSGEINQSPDQDGDLARPSADSVEDAQDEESTLVAEDTSVLSIPADSESSPELIGPQLESPEESKGTSSDEMVTSTDSEVAHSSWTLLEAMNQDGAQEWPSVPQDVGQSWVTTSMEREASTVQADASSVVIRETVQVHLTPQSSFSSSDPNVPLFAQALAEELQKRYSELLAELQRLREEAETSQERIKILEEEAQSLTTAKEEAEAEAVRLSNQVKSTLENGDMVEKQTVEMRHLKEELETLKNDNKTKEEKMEALQGDLETMRHTLAEQEREAKMLGAQLEDRELLSSDLQRRLHELEISLLEHSQTSDLHHESLSRKDSEIQELQLLLAQREKDATELSDSMSGKLLQAEEEKLRIKEEVSKLKEQIEELEKVRNERQSASGNDKELAGWRTEKKEMEAQLANTKKKLQAALVQRKELMKKVGEFEEEAKRWKEKDETEGASEKPQRADVRDLEEKIAKLEEALRSKEEAVEALELQVHHKEFMKKVDEFEEEAKQKKEMDESEMEEASEKLPQSPEVQDLEKIAKLEEALRAKEEAVETLQQTIRHQDQVLTETLALNRKLSEEAENAQQPEASLQLLVASLEAECETLQRKFQEAQESRKETIRKAKEKDRHHREQMKQLKDEYNELTERFDVQSGEREGLLDKLRELEEKAILDRSDPCPELAQTSENNWAQEDWVDFAASETESSKPQSSEQPPVTSTQLEESVQALKDEIQNVRCANSELEKQLQESQTSLSQKESEMLELLKELDKLREKEKQICALSEELSELREKHLQAEAYTETLKAEMDVASKASAESAMKTLQAEVEEFKQFLDDKNREISDLSQQLREQSSLIHSMQDSFSGKDQLISSLQDELKAKQERIHKMEADDGEAKLQQLQRKLQAALVSRKEALKENKTLKEQVASAEKIVAELQEKIDSTEEELENLRGERARLIEEVDRTLLENQSLGSSCESLKLAMEGMISEKDACRKEAEMAKEEAARRCREWEEKVQGMKDEYETLLKSYENVSDEAERVRRVLEAARQERQELASKVRAHEAARLETEMRAEEAQKEVDTVKDKMRKFAKTKQQKISQLEEENERLREAQEKTSSKRGDGRLQEEVGVLRAELEAAVAERDALRLQFGRLTGDSDTVAEEISLEDKTREVETITAGRELRQKRECDLQAELASLEQALKESKCHETLLEKNLEESMEREKHLIQEASKREARFKELEAEKDNLEERLNQLAEPNGSIPAFQKEVAEDQERLAVSRLEAERRAEEAQKEVEAVKDQMRKFARTQQQKISELEEKNERLKQALEKSVSKQDNEHLQPELEVAVTERDSLRLQIGRLANNSDAVSLEKAQGVLKDTTTGFETPNAERELWLKRESELQAELDSLEQALRESQSNKSHLERSLQESNKRETHLIEEASQREARFKELETEKDNLEERLMNQLAQLNGSIAAYQQQAADDRERLAESQLEAERLEVEVRREVEHAARLEEDVRQARRERAEAEAESGKQRELEQQLRSAQRVKEGSQSRAKQLEELLREKQLEVRQLQKDSILYQEKISELGREGKALQLGQEELRGQLERSELESARTVEDLRRTEAEMEICKSQLAEARKEASEAASARAATERSFQEREAALKVEAEQTLDSVRFRLGAELKDMELRLEEAYGEREREEDSALQAREMAEATERRALETQARLDEALARLAAFSRSMSSLQDDRDRVLDEARQWEARFNSALQGKEAEVREAETRAKELADQLQKETALKHELQQSVSRLQKAEKDWQQRLEEEEKKVAEHQAVVELERSKLEETASELLSAQNEGRALKNELEALGQRARALEEAVGKLTGEADRARTELMERGAEERRLCLSVEQLETDLRSSKVLTESLQAELQEKERREVELLGEKEQAVAQAAEEARKEAESRAQDAERELEQRRGEARELEERLRRAEEDSSSQRAKLDSFTKAMGSLQDDRDRVLHVYKQLEEKHLQVMMEKDGLIQEAAGENNSLKEELRSLLVQRDDMHAEQAKLSAQLHGYRDELNQVLSMKDSQHKQLLAAQRERIASLEKEHQELEEQLRSLSRAREEEVRLVELETASRASEVTDAPGAEVEKLREQLQKERARAEALEERLLAERQDREGESRELAELRWEGGVTRSEAESAQERVAELARDLLMVEQRLLEETDTTRRLRAENQAFAKAMASLQETRDRAEGQVRELSARLEETGGAARGGPGGSAGEVWGLKNALQALQNDRERLLEQLNGQTAELKRQKSDLARLGAGELIKVSQELLEEKRKNEDMLGAVTQLENMVEMRQQETESLRLERMDWMAQAEQLKQQTLATLSEKDQQLRRLTAMLEEARLLQPKLRQEQLQRQSSEEGDSPPGAPQGSSVTDSLASKAELLELQRRLEEETQQRLAAEEQLMVTQDRLKRHRPPSWRSADQADLSETAVFIEPPEGAVTRTRRGGPGPLRMLRAALCSRQRTPLLLGLYLLTVHVLLLLCLGGFL